MGPFYDELGRAGLERFRALGVRGENYRNRPWGSGLPFCGLARAHPGLWAGLQPMGTREEAGQGDSWCGREA